MVLIMELFLIETFIDLCDLSWLKIIKKYPRRALIPRP